MNGFCRRLETRSSGSLEKQQSLSYVDGDAGLVFMNLRNYERSLAEGYKFERTALVYLVPTGMAVENWNSMKDRPISVSLSGSVTLKYRTDLWLTGQTAANSLS